MPGEVDMTSLPELLTFLGIYGNNPTTLLFDNAARIYRKVETCHFRRGEIVHAVEGMWQHAASEDRYEQITTRCDITVNGYLKLTEGVITCLVCLAMEPPT